MGDHPFCIPSEYNKVIFTETDQNRKKRQNGQNRTDRTDRQTKQIEK